MRKEDLEVLKKYDDIFVQLKNGVTHILPTMLMREECSKVYTNLYGRIIPKGEWNCPHCAYKIYKQLSVVYFEELNKEVVKELEPTVENQQVSEVKVSNNTKKKRTKK